VLVTALFLALGAVGIATPALLPVADAAPMETLDLGLAVPSATASPEPSPSTAMTRRAAAPPSPAPTTPAPSATPTSRPAAAGTADDDDAEKGQAHRQEAAAIRPVADVKLEGQVAALVNLRRTEAGCGRLRTDSRLARASLDHSRDMATKNYFSHTGTDGSSPWDRAKREGYLKPTGENLAAGHQTAAEVVQAWMDSPGHKKNILDCKSKAIGIGLAHGGSYGTYWTQLFGTV
jgi:uncharacterized protein YkwD